MGKMVKSISDDYRLALNQIDDLGPYIELVSQLKDMADDGLVNDMRRLLVVFCGRERVEAMAKFGLKKGVKYDIKASDKVIVITPSQLKKDKSWLTEAK